MPGSDNNFSNPTQGRHGQQLGLALAIGSPLFFAAFDNGLRLLDGSISIFGLLLLRGILGLTLVAALSRLTATKLTLDKPCLLALIGLTGALASAAGNASITMIPLYQAVVLVLLYPAMSVFMARLILGERITLRALTRVIIAFIGCVLLVLPDQTSGLNLSWGHVIGFFGAALYALSFVLTRRLGPANHGLEPFLFYCLACVAVSWPLSFLSPTGFGIDNLTETALGLALVSLSALGQLTAFAALKHLPAHTVGVFGTLEILCGALSSWLLFSDPFSPTAIIGSAVIIYAAFGFRESHLPPPTSP
ncbi:MAG: DMT family transporter [Deltaproteobacteria bacterium]|jgi:S-adenosylmethionine uptake transporter|nr:DMT family transporter [Deltaproteobacteria bacterium]